MSEDMDAADTHPGIITKDIDMADSEPLDLSAMEETLPPSIHQGPQDATPQNLGTGQFIVFTCKQCVISKAKFSDWHAVRHTTHLALFIQMYKIFSVIFIIVKHFTDLIPC